ncbi:hypothetical protein BS47DRAFT_1393707 [Hydnum rufescens UP504]|uniref:Uncharacterized protein n=1 Tax=Hydnum rufescens UP504 TaxID=1448309 RepID=A0A9P6DVR8_9AGAM|nr:hypothetical protein BS47DRAFT_1393707 [Hydnum rufescens UP504]
MPEEQIIWTDTWVRSFGILALLQPGRIERDCLVTWQAINVDLLRFKLAPVPPSLSQPIKNATLGSYNNIPVTSTPNDETPALPWALAPSTSPPTLLFLSPYNIAFTSTPNDKTPALPWTLAIFLLKGLNFLPQPHVFTHRGLVLCQQGPVSLSL